MKNFKLIFLIIAAALAAACQNGNESESETDLTIYTTVYPLEYIAQEIGGDTVDVSSVYPPGADGHSYEPTIQEMTQFADGDAFFYVGDSMEAFSDSIASALGSENVELIGLSEHEELFQKTPHNEEEASADTGDASVTLQGVQDHYHTGDKIEITAEYTGGTDHFHWYTRASESDEWSEVSGEYHDTIELEATDEIAQVKAEQFSESHEVLTESEPVDIIIDDHEGEDAHHYENHDEENTEEADNDASSEGSITIEDLAGHYHTGDIVELNVSADLDYDTLQWYTLSPDDEDWQESEQSDETVFEGEATSSLAQVKVAALDENGEVIEEYEAVDIVIDDHEDSDPHIWIDPLKMIEVAEIVRDEMTALNPEEEALYSQNFESLKADLENLDQELNDTLNDGEEKHIIVPHAAYGYWEKYGVEQIPITGYSMTDEPSQRQLGELINAAQDYNLDYVLYEQNNEGKISRVIQDEIGAEAEVIHNMEVRTEEDIDNGEDYISLMQRNLETLVKVTE